jgi:hypothetical protein
LTAGLLDLDFAETDAERILFLVGVDRNELDDEGTSKLFTLSFTFDERKYNLP